MPQRQVRLGDVLDDYCPRERRLTNHAVVALVGNEIKLTRCTTCDSEHPYKAARVPPRRHTESLTALSSAGGDGDVGEGPALQGAMRSEISVTAAADTPPPLMGEPVQVKGDSVRRPLIRATLERPEGIPPPPRQAPVFTIRENSNRGGKPAWKHRTGGRTNGEPNGNQAEGHHGQSSRSSGKGKNESRPLRTRGSGGRNERLGKNSSRNRGKSRSR